MSRQEDRAGQRARRILERLGGSSRSLAESAGRLDESRLAERLQQIEQLFLLHGGERGNSDGPGPDDVLFEWGHLQVLAHLGEGSFGDVYRAYDRTLDREVALKLLKTDQDRLFQSRLFLHEARQLALVRHRNVLAVHGAAVHENRPGLWTDLIDGATAHDERYRESFTQLESLLELVESLAQALQAVHSAGLVHGDVKPSNIMRDASGDWILMDFGASHDQRLARDGPSSTSGTPLYMAPEVVLGQPPSVQSDLYSMGATLYRVLAGRAPIEAKAWSELKGMHAAGRSSQSATRVRGLNPRIARLIDRLMAQEPTLRPSLADVLDRIQSIREAPQRRFRRLALISIAGTLLLGLTLTSVGFYRANEARLAAVKEQRNTAAVNRFLQRVLATPTTTGRARDMTVEDMLQQAASDVGPALAGQDEAQVVVHRVLAESFNTLRRPDIAEAQISIARERLQAHGLSMPTIERGLELMAIRAAELDDRHEESIALSERFVEAHLEELGDDHMNIRWARLYQVTNHLSLSRFDRAEALMQAHFQEVPDPETAENHFGYEMLQAWANLHRGRGRYGDAIETAERALDWLDRYPLARPINRASALTNLALNLARVNRPERAIEVLEALLPIQERIFGVASGKYVGTLINLGAVQREAGRVGDSGATLQAALDLIQSHPDIVPEEQQVIVQLNLANVLNATGRPEQAEALMRKSRLRAIDLWGPSHQHVLTQEYNLAELLSQQGRFDEARALAEQTLERKREALGDKHVLTLLTMDNLAVALAGLDRGNVALQLHTDALESLQDQLGSEHPFALLVERHRTETLLSVAPEQISSDALSTLVERHAKALGEEHPDTAQARALIDRNRR